MGARLHKGRVGRYISTKVSTNQLIVGLVQAAFGSHSVDPIDQIPHSLASRQTHLQH